MRQATRKQWVKFIIVALLYIAFLVWVRCWWGIVLLPVIFDIYISKRVPWTFWRKLKNPTARYIMSWVDAIVFALVAVYFVNVYFFQNYQIPSSSLEKSLLVGDFLYVSKVSYGPRVPNTPLAMPLTQNTLPIVNTDSYLDWPLWGYKRAAGLGKVKLGDIVVFNFPAGDTVTVNTQTETDYYSIVYQEGRDVYSKPVDMDNQTRRQQRMVYDLYYAAGRKAVLANEAKYGKVLWRPVDRRENYVKRCTGLPGDTLQIVNGQVMVNGVAMPNPEDMQQNYYVRTNVPRISEEMFRQLGISKADQGIYDTDNVTSTYMLPLTKKMYDTLAGNKKLVRDITLVPDLPESTWSLFPKNLYKHWDRDNYGPIWIPAKGATVTLTEDNLPFYERCIGVYEGNKLELKDDGIYINGQKTDQYTFKMDYYWMMGDNRHNSADSRYWGFVPEDHVVGKPIVVWLSLDKDRGWFDGKIRWSRIFKWVR